MAKPPLAPWATDATYPADAEPEAGTETKTAYTLGQATLGWRPKARPPAREFNTWMNRVGNWIDYLNAHLWEDDLHITGALEVDGAVTLHDNLTLDDAEFVMNGGLIRDLSGTSSFDNAIDVSGNISADGDVAIGGRFAFAGGELHALDMGAAIQPAADHTISDAQIILGASADAVDIPIRLPVGAQILGYRLDLQKNTEGASVIEPELLEVYRGATTFYTLPTIEDDSPGNLVIDEPTLIVDAPTEYFILADRHYYLRVTPPNDITPAADRVWWAGVYWNKPL